MSGREEDGFTDNLFSLEMQRARRQLEDWCHRRVPPAEGCHWSLEDGGSGFLLRRAGGVPVLRLCRTPDRWKLLVPAADGGWRPYPALPEAASVAAVIEELDQAPLHIHW